jgi:hypothetical protein
MGPWDGMLTRHLRPGLGMHKQGRGRSQLCARFHSRDKDLEGRRGNVLWAQGGYGLALC